MPTDALDVMQVCRNGHVITGRLLADPASGRTHCDRCGAVTLEGCPTCGEPLPGVGRVLDLVTIGTQPPPGYCPRCGGAFPWLRRPRPAPEPLERLETLLRRLPQTVRQLRWRQTDRPPFRVEDERDLEDLVRALLPLCFDDVRPETRTPSYSPATRTDFVLPGPQLALTLKLMRPGLAMEPLSTQWDEDEAYYRQRGGVRVVVGFVYDPEGALASPGMLQTMVAAGEGLERRCVVGG
jgi:hypothetical protein